MMAASELGTDDLNRYVDKRRNEGASNATINREMATLRRIFDIARASTPPKVRVLPVFPHLTENAPRQGFVEDQKYTKLASHADELWLKAILATAYTFGFRKSELLLNMKVRQIDLENRTIRLFTGTTKNNEGRLVKMTAEVYGLLRHCVWRLTDTELARAGEVFMRWTASLSFFLVFSLFALPALSQLGTPLGRCGVQPRDAGAPQNQLPTEQVSLEDRKTLTLDMVSLHKDAQELADLAASICTDIERANRGLLSKDVVEKLKRVEKLSKHLRSGLTR